MYYIYALIDPINKVPFYIGKGTGNRAYDHLNGKDVCNIKKVNYIKTLRQLNFEPEIGYIIENINNENEAYLMESAIIRNAKLFGITLTNRVGVDMRPPNRKGAKMSVETRNKISKSQIGRKKGPLSIETKTKLRIANLGKGRVSKLNLNKTELETLYIKQNLTRKEISSRFGVSLYPVNRLLRKYSLSKL